MNTTPSQYPSPTVSNLADQVYMQPSHGTVEQSAIYENVHFTSVDENCHAIVLTSQCDIQTADPSSYILIARIAPVACIFNWWLITQNGYTDEEVQGNVRTGGNKKKRKNVTKDFAGSYMRNQTFAYYFLPEIESRMPASFVCCDITECVRKDELEHHNKIAVLRSPFREAVPTHFAAYIGRIGTPSFGTDYLLAEVERVCKLQD